MRVEMVSDGSVAGKNEDASGYVRHSENHLDIWVLDGATSVAERAYLGREESDPAWFARRFSEELAAHLCVDIPLQETVQNIALNLGQAYESLCDVQDPPAYAKPIAAATLARLARRDDGAVDISLIGLADCTSLILTEGVCANLDPYENPQENLLLQQYRQSHAEGVTDRAEKVRRIMPFLRQRRVEQNSKTAPEVLRLHPGEGFAFRVQIATASAGNSLLVMSDGFYRLVDTYGLYSDQGLAAAIEERGVSALLGELRAYEKGDAEALEASIKKADDATAVLVRL